jgi:hypothetical protein
MIRPRHALTALASALVFGCAPSVEIDAPDIEITQPNLQFQAAPSSAGPGTSVTAPFKFTTNKLGATNNPDAGSLKNIERLQITRVVLKANNGIEDFSFLNHLTVLAANTSYATESSPGRPVIKVIDYEAPYEVAIGPVLQLPLTPPVDMLPLWGRTWLYLTVTATGNLPKVAWSMDVVFSLSLKLTQ